MKATWNIIQLIFATVGAWLGWYFGGFDKLFYALVAFVVADYITGVMYAIQVKNLSSLIGRNGILKKVLIFALVGIGNLIDNNILGDGSIVRTAVIFFYISNEGISLLENVSNLGLPIPKKLKDVLVQLNDEEENDDKKNNV